MPVLSTTPSCESLLRLSFVPAYKEADRYFPSHYSPSWVRERFTEIASHEQTHVEFLSTALTAAGATPVKACTYDFGVTSPETFLATSQILEGVGKLYLHAKAALLCTF